MFLSWPNAAGKQKPIQIHHAITSTDDLQPRRLRAFSGKVESGFPFENATNAKELRAHSVSMKSVCALVGYEAGQRADIGRHGEVLAITRGNYDG